ncbi:TrbC/VirB2 family protein [Pseudoxanthomonas wuyuanensis]
MNPTIYRTETARAKNLLGGLMMATVFTGMLLLPGLAFAADEFAEAEGKVEGFFNSINGLLNVASIAVVTIAVIFAGYQIAFAHKRISDVAPVLIGGFLIGAAAQIAKMLMGSDSTLDTGTTMLVSTLSAYYA